MGWRILGVIFRLRIFTRKKPKLARLWPALTRNELETARKQMFTSLADFEEHYSTSDRRIGWFQSQFVQRVDKMTKIKGLSLVADLRANPFPEKRTLTVDEVLTRLKKISPGFIESAKAMR